MKKTFHNMKIALCASMAFYRHVSEVAAELEKQGITVIIPNAARLMQQEKNWDVEAFLNTHYGQDRALGRRKAIKSHFAEIAGSDAILVINDTKHGIPGYIGPNVLMEMGVAFHLGKKIFLLYNFDLQSSFKDEIEAMEPVVLNGQLLKII